LKLKLFDDSFIEKEIQTFFSDETPNLYLEKVIISKILEQKEKNKSIISIKNSLLKS
jgi:hypothetical protein